MRPAHLPDPRSLEKIELPEQSVVYDRTGTVELARFGEHALVHVAERHHIDRSDLNQPQQIGLPVPARADETDAFGLFSGGFPV